MSFLFCALPGTQAVFEKAILPCNTGVFGNIALPVAQDLFHVLWFRKLNHGMPVVWHGQKEHHAPFTRSLIVINRTFHDFKECNLIGLTMPALSAANRQGISRIVTHPLRRLVVQSLPLRQLDHDERRVKDNAPYLTPAVPATQTNRRPP